MNVFGRLTNLGKGVWLTRRGRDARERAADDLDQELAAAAPRVTTARPARPHPAEPDLDAPGPSEPAVPGEPIKRTL
jgi:hypothetical protein